jgi:hypothetical protein
VEWKDPDRPLDEVVHRQLLGLGRRRVGGVPGSRDVRRNRSRDLDPRHLAPNHQYLSFLRYGAAGAAAAVTAAVTTTTKEVL